MSFSRIFLLIFLSSFVTIVDGQALEGLVVNTITNEPLPYCNVGFLNKNIGTVTNENGAFKLDVSNMSLTDTIRISCIGYESFEITELNIDSKNENIIKLKPIFFQIPEIQISNKKVKTYILGNTVKWDKMSISFMSRQLGAELGTLIRLKKQATIEQIRFHINKTTLDSLVLRVNIYDLMNGLPCNNLLKKPIVVRVKNVVGDVCIDISDYNIVLDDDFVICIENFKELGNSKSGLAISASVFNNPSYYRLGSQGKWYKVRYKKINVGIGLSVKMRQ